MENLIQGGSPAEPSSLSSWNIYQVQIKKNKTYGQVFSIAPNGYMTQSKYIYKTLTEMQIIITYQNLNEEGIGSELILYSADEEDTHIFFYMEPTATFATLTIPVTNIPSGMTQINFALKNPAKAALTLSDIYVGGTFSASSGVQTDTEAFVKYAILYGSDANKPKLR